MNYTPATPGQQREMLEACGVSSIDELFSDIPAGLAPRSFDLPPGMSELEMVGLAKTLSAQNRSDLLMFTGGGFYDHFIPAAADAIIGRSEFYTAYTPYQAERSQGTLQAIYEYQSQIRRLTGMDTANASLYDGGTALYEACKTAVAATGRNRIAIDAGVNPIYRAMIAAHCRYLGYELREIASDCFGIDRAAVLGSIDEQTAAVVLQNPNFFGVIDDHTDIAAAAHGKGALLIQSFYPIALGLIKTPGEMGVDIATAEGQSLGLPLSFGGPYLGIMATRRELVRRMPGRIAGKTVDVNGREGYVLTLQAREQHIRREKATSNICTNQGLCALKAHAYLALLGKEGLVRTATLCAEKAAYARSLLGGIPGVTTTNHPVFNEFVINLPINADVVVRTLLDHGIASGLPLGLYYPGMEKSLLVAVTEKRTSEEIQRLARDLESSL